MPLKRQHDNQVKINQFNLLSCHSWIPFNDFHSVFNRTLEGFLNITNKQLIFLLSLIFKIN